jgi:hypothetical protein
MSRIEKHWGRDSRTKVETAKVNSIQPAPTNIPDIEKNAQNHQ